jgi:integration host factor subunit beta
MLRSELVERLAAKRCDLDPPTVKDTVEALLDQMSTTLADGERIEIRGFGSFSRDYLPPRAGRNPKTGESVAVPGRYKIHFKPGKALKQRVNQGRKTR